MKGEQNMKRAGYRWDVIADFPGNRGAVRVAVRTTNRGAVRFADVFRRRNHVRLGEVWIRLWYDPLLDDVLNARKRRR